MVRRFNSRFPTYPDDADYTTNSPSYYDDLARKNKLIKVLAEKIGFYDEELEKRFEVWDKLIEELQVELKRMLQVWLDRKCKRLKSSHVLLSYAVLCL